MKALTVNSLFRDEVATREKSDKEVATTNSKVSVPSWVVTILVTTLLVFLANFGASFYWAGQMVARQELAERQLSEMKQQLQRLNDLNQEMRERLAAMTISQRPR